jgi:hypothetical protein
VYLRNNFRGSVTAVTQDELKQRAANVQTAVAQPASTSAAPIAPVGRTGETHEFGCDHDGKRGAFDGHHRCKMSSTTCDFDTSPDALKQLKVARVPDAIVLEMIKRSK